MVAAQINSTSYQVIVNSNNASRVKKKRSYMTNKDQVIILIHGIRDRALWQNEIGSVLRKEFEVEPANYGRFDIFRFLVPISFFRNQAIESVWDQIRDIRKRYPNRKYSFVAHS
jgi:hypothetical protein